MSEHGNDSAERRFAPGWKMTAFVAVFLPLTVALGFWQIGRGQEKQRLEEQFLAGQGRLPVDAKGAVAAAPFTRVRLRGRYDPERYFLLDNQVMAGRVGYDVVALFLADDGRTYFVDRGWVQAGERRADLPAVDAPAADVTIVSVVWRNSALSLGGVGEPFRGAWPERIERIDLERMRARAGAGEPIELRLEPGAPGALGARFVDPNFSPVRHFGYAVQWFGLALALTILFGVYGLRGNR